MSKIKKPETKVSIVKTVGGLFTVDIVIKLPVTGDTKIIRLINCEHDQRKMEEVLTDQIHVFDTPATIRSKINDEMKIFVGEVVVFSHG